MFTLGSVILVAVLLLVLFIMLILLKKMSKTFVRLMSSAFFHINSFFLAILIAGFIITLLAGIFTEVSVPIFLVIGFFLFCAVFSLILTVGRSYDFVVSSWIFHVAYGIIDGIILSKFIQYRYLVHTGTSPDMIVTVAIYALSIIGLSALSLSELYYALK